MTELNFLNFPLVVQDLIVEKIISNKNDRIEFGSVCWYFSWLLNRTKPWKIYRSSDFNFNETKISMRLYGKKSFYFNNFEELKNCSKNFQVDGSLFICNYRLAWKNFLIFSKTMKNIKNLKFWSCFFDDDTINFVKNLKFCEQFNGEFENYEWCEKIIKNLPSLKIISLSIKPNNQIFKLLTQKSFNCPIKCLVFEPFQNSYAANKYGFDLIEIQQFFKASFFFMKFINFKFFTDGKFC